VQRIGLAFSGGGFRATLFHLGMARLLREGNILPGVTRVTSVSGGSILAAHLVLNWHLYTGSLKDFDAAAAELLRFVQLVMRRYRWRCSRERPPGILWPGILVISGQCRMMYQCLTPKAEGTNLF
jgi:predicted acylesterase/phospholipase RssA